jgi:acetoin utilization deacetylase AcuC-like enzyme
VTGVLYATDHFPLPLPPGHRFPLAKYARLRERIAARVPDLLAVAPAATDGELGHAHDAAYVMATSAGTLGADAQRRIGFPWSTAMVERSRRSTGATLAACRSALATGCAVNLAGGTHHAHRDFGAGFCVFNDAAVAARAMQAEGRIRRAIVVDLDVHQGDGTASIFAGDASVFTFSIHGRDNFPFRKAASDLDIELADGTGDDAYLSALQTGLQRALDRARPQLAIYLAGADPYAGDRLGRLALTKAGLAARDRAVLDALQALGVPVAIAMAGGYADDVDDVVDIHAATVGEAIARFAPERMLDWRIPCDPGAGPCA